MNITQKVVNIEEYYVTVDDSMSDMKDYISFHNDNSNFDSTDRDEVNNIKDTWPPPSSQQNSQVRHFFVGEQVGEHSGVIQIEEQSEESILDSYEEKITLSSCDEGDQQFLEFNEV